MTANQQQTLYFVGVTTGQSSILKVFPRWCEALGLDAAIKGIDIAPNSAPEIYRDAILRIRDDARSPGALITTHKLNVWQAARDLFDDVDDYSCTLEEINSVSKRGNRMIGHAKDPVTVGFGLEAIVEDRYWKRSGGHMLILGSGGSALALTLYLHNRKAAGGDVPEKIVVTARRQVRLEEMREVHRRIGFPIPIDYRLAPSPEDGDAIVAELPEGSMTVNATGLGKDAPGSPLSDAVVFPRHGIVWEFNYRGDLIFLDQAKRRAAADGLKVEDGWVYFIHGWTRVIAEAFAIDIPVAGPEFDRLSRIALQATRS